MRHTSAALALLAGFTVLTVLVLFAHPLTGAAQQAAPGLALPALPARSGPGLSADVTISLSPSGLTVAANQIFTMDIVINSGSQLVDGAQASICFDPAILAVVDNAGNPAGQIIEGTAFSTHIMNTADNSTGRIFYADGQLTGDPVSGAFTLATIRFKAKIAGVSAVTFILDQNPQTKVTLQGANVLTSAQNGSVTVGTPAATATPTRTLTPTRTRTPTVPAAATATATPTTPPGGPIIRLAPASGAIGQATLIDIVVDAGTQPLDGAQAFLTFSPTYLQVVDNAGNASSTIIAVRPMASEICPPNMVRASTSRPASSVPKGNSALGGCRRLRIEVLLAYSSVKNNDPMVT